MSATEIRLQWLAVVADLDHQPPWMRALCEETDETADDLVSVMLRAEMAAAGNAFMLKHPDLFRYPENGLA